jgi:predicted polyphosphate/ATP-dependent NAD kinase
MNVGEIARSMEADIKVVGDMEKDVNGCYVSDLLSDVLANSKEGDLWITHQSHPNVVAVASVRGLSGVIITGNRDIEPETIKKAEAEQVNIITSPSSTYELAGAVYTLLK